MLEWSCNFTPDKSEFKNCEWSETRVKHFSEHVVGKVGKSTKKHWYRKKVSGDVVVVEFSNLPKI